MLFLRDYEYNGDNVVDVSAVSAPYPSFTEDIFIDNNIIQLEDNAIIKMEHKLEIISLEGYPEIGATIYDFELKKFVEETPEFILGDLNGDGNLNIIDLIAMVNLALSGVATSETHPEADMNGDGGVNISDIVTLAHLILEGNQDLTSINDIITGGY